MDKSNASSSFPWPPFLAGVILAVAGLISILFPQPFLPAATFLLWPVAGILIIFLGLYIIFLAQKEFHRAGTPPDPTKPVTAFTDNGIYGFTRNPMYLGICLFIFGLSVALNSLWLLLGLPVFVLGVWQLAIKREEQYMTDRFGEVYKDYKTRVPRWFGPF